MCLTTCVYCHPPPLPSPQDRFSIGPECVFSRTNVTPCSGKCRHAPVYCMHSDRVTYTFLININVNIYSCIYISQRTNNCTRACVHAYHYHAQSLHIGPETFLEGLHQGLRFLAPGCNRTHLSRRYGQSEHTMALLWIEEATGPGRRTKQICCR